MGLFDGIKLMGDIIKEGIASAKKWEQLDELLNKAVTEHMDIFTPKQKEMYDNYLACKTKAERLEDKDQDAYNKASEEQQGAELYLMSSLSRNARMPQNLKDQIKAVVAELEKEDENAEKLVKDYMLKQAKNDKERQEVLDAFAEEDAKKGKK
ncbi:MAG: hypothetical protein V3G42_13665 [Oscillospiraceae bacterium]